MCPPPQSRVSRTRSQPSESRRRRRRSSAAAVAVLGSLLSLPPLLAAAALARQPRPPAAAHPAQPAGALAATAPHAAVVLHARLASIIQPVAAEFLRSTLERADAMGAAAVVVELDTPGGLMTSMHEMTKAILGARTPVVVYVAPSGAQAASAGFFLLMAADVAAMAPGTRTGAAHPVGAGGESIAGTIGQKVEQDAAAGIRSLAARNGRDAALAQQAVVTSRSFSAGEALAAHLVDLMAP